VAPTPSTVNVEFEHVHPLNIDGRLVDAAVSGLAGLPLSGEVSLVITGQMKSSYGERIGGEYRESFTDERVSAGRVVAKVVTRDGRAEILLAATVIARGMEGHRDMPLSRLVRHEGLHLLLRQREEDVHHLMGAPVTESQTLVAWMAALALEEYRIELSLCREGSFASRCHADEMPAMLRDYIEEFGLLGARWGEPDCATDALSMTNDLIVKLALMAAEEAIQPSVGEVLVTSEPWQTLIGSNWDAMGTAISTLPDALISAPEQARTAIEHFKPVVIEFCRRVGFQLVDGPDGVYVEPITGPNDTP
jgi:hypothetical protein